MLSHRSLTPRLPQQRPVMCVFHACIMYNARCAVYSVHSSVLYSLSAHALKSPYCLWFVWNCHPRYPLLLFGRSCIINVKMICPCIKMDCENIKENLNKCVNLIKYWLTLIVPCGLPFVLLGFDLFILVIYERKV